MSGALSWFLRENCCWHIIQSHDPGTHNSPESPLCLSLQASAAGPFPGRTKEAFLGLQLRWLSAWLYLPLWSGRETWQVLCGSWKKEDGWSQWCSLKEQVSPRYQSPCSVWTRFVPWTKSKICGQSQRESSSGGFLFGLLGFLWGRLWSSQWISLLEKLSPLEPLLWKECVRVLCAPWGICLETGDQCSWLVKVDAEARSMVGDGTLTCSLSCGLPLMWS